ncbi:hypothetical protein [Dyadobacter sp. 3J3]|uniref:hypothetical protein n=1 Tax=Dyadobacter sp. 3J3 TaxID=2606600 RepID=UPI00135BDEFC|nr:hypothetical protein [Dyadobacter sp. 3J3]
MTYDEADFVAYALEQMDITVIKRDGKYFDLQNDFTLEVEQRALYKLSHKSLVISPFDDIGKLCTFIKNATRPDAEQV